ncbi:MAG TPA: CHAP domain-containing protein, partial [Candidatus Absconditabacterales bacterium]|nr:CHAP domain-containing protein [Candidatus Absconditabacterales bacterium]
SALKGWQTGSPFDDKWERVTYEKGKVPKLGDIFFLDKTSKNPYGHTGVIYEGSTPETMVVVEQNAGTGNGDGKGGNAITKRSYGYNTSRGRVLGWFTLKTNLGNMQTEQTVSKFKEIYIQERPRGYEPIFSDLSGIEIATISDIKYLIEIANIRSSKK